MILPPRVFLAICYDPEQNEAIEGWVHARNRATPDQTMFSRRCSRSCLIFGTMIEAKEKRTEREWEGRKREGHGTRRPRSTNLKPPRHADLFNKSASPKINCGPLNYLYKRKLQIYINIDIEGVRFFVASFSVFLSPFLLCHFSSLLIRIIRIAK